MAIKEKAQKEREVNEKKSLSWKGTDNSGHGEIKRLKQAADKKRSGHVTALEFANFEQKHPTPQTQHICTQKVCKKKKTECCAVGKIRGLFASPAMSADPVLFHTCTPMT